MFVSLEAGTLSVSFPDRVLNRSQSSSKMAACSSEPEPPPMKKPRVVSAFPGSGDEAQATTERAGKTSVKEEAYYSANFKAILSTVLSTSHERHVISSDAVSAVERFMALPGGVINLHRCMDISANLEPAVRVWQS